MSWQDRYFARFYDPARGYRDGTTRFHELVAAHVSSEGRLLEVGAGPANPTTHYLAGLGEVHGLDPDPDVSTNEDLASAHLLEGERFPFDDDAFDGAVSNYVVEHVDDAVGHLREIKRVLRPGGCYVFRTPNRYHYVPLGASMTPHWLHVKLANRLRNLPPDAHDPYPTRYRLNTRRAIRREAAASGLDVAHLEVIEPEPSYGRASRIMFFAFMAYERVVNATGLLEDLRGNILGVLRNPVA